MIELPELSLYISHTCDIACESCFTYNNLNWGKHFKYDGKSFDYIKDKVMFDVVCIIGGEPATNPYLGEWMNTVDNCLISNHKFIVTNGRNLDKINQQYPNWQNNNWKLEISAHSLNDLEIVFDWFYKNFKNVIIEKFYDDRHEDGMDHYNVYVNKKCIAEITEAWFFYKDSLVIKENKEITWNQLYDEYETHKKCIAKECMYFLDGRFYRCSRQALLPYLTKTFKIDKKYKNLTELDLGCTAEDFVEWSKTRLEPQIQCRFCAWNEKIKLPKISNTKKLIAKKN